VLAALLALLAIPAAVGAAVYLRSDGGAGGGSRLPVAASSAGRAATAQQTEAVGPPTTTDGVKLTGRDAFRMRMGKPPRAALDYDVDSGRVLWRRDPLRVLPIASLTKIMTALLVVNNAGPDERVKITKAALGYQGSGVGVLPRGKRVRLETLMNGLLLVSGNDAAIALADHVSGDERRFVALMNSRARELGLRCTHFASSHGLQRGNRSCPADLAALTRLAMKQPRITRIVRRRQVGFRFPINGGKLFLASHNPLLRAGYRGAIGLKTGFTAPAGRCFVGVARRNGRTLGVVLLHSPNPLKHAAKLLNKGFAAKD
jgi:D-alanyl-D-alanine carboxypeptidase (penicillin-binding protein 5/6)